MKRSPVLVVLIALVSAFAAAQTPAAHPSQTAAARPAASSAAVPVKVGVIAFQAAVGQTNEFQRDFGTLQTKYEPKRLDLKKVSDEIDSLTKQLQGQAATLNDAERAARARTIDEKKKVLQRETEDAQGDYQTDIQEVINRVAAKVGDVMTAYANQHGYTLILDASQSQQQSPIVLYAADSADITKAIIDAYNEKSGVPAPAAQPSAPVAPRPTTSH